MSADHRDVQLRVLRAIRVLNNFAVDAMVDRQSVLLTVDADGQRSSGYVELSEKEEVYCLSVLLDVSAHLKSLLVQLYSSRVVLFPSSTVLCFLRIVHVILWLASRPLSVAVGS